MDEFPRLVVTARCRGKPRLYLDLASAYIHHMALRKIVKMGNPVLAARAAPVDAANMERVVALLPDMVETMRAAGGVGLAAPQVGESLRVIIFEVPEGRASDTEGDGPLALQTLINPEIEPIGKALELGWEGCLSIPGLRGEVPRHAQIRYTGLDGEGNRVTREAAGLHARVVQHEVDHLDGILYLERMTDMRRIGYADEMAEAAIEAKLSGRGEDE
jgi:peptide deformylase